MAMRPIVGNEAGEALPAPVRNHLYRIAMFQDTPLQTTEADWSQLLPGLKLTHTIYLVSEVKIAAVANIAMFLDARLASVKSWTVIRINGVMEQRIVLEDMTERLASTVREDLLKLEVILRARVEHNFSRPSARDNAAHISAY